MTELSIGVSSGAGKKPRAILRRPGTRVVISATAGLLFLLLARWWLVDLHWSDRQEELRGLLHSVLRTTRASIHDWASGVQREAVLRSQRAGLVPAVQELSVLPPGRGRLSSSPASSRLRKLLLQARSSTGAARPLNDYLLVSPAGLVLAAWKDSAVGSMVPLSPGSPIRSALQGRPQTASVETLLAAAGSEKRPASDAPAGARATSIVTAAPIRDTSGNVLAALAFRLEARDELQRLADLARVGKTGRTYAYSGDRTWLTSLGGPAEASGEPASTSYSRYPVARSLTGTEINGGTQSCGDNVEGYQGRFGNKVVGAWCLVDGLGIGLVTEMEFQEAFLRLHRLQGIMVTFNMVAALLVIGLVLASRYPRTEEAELRALGRPRRSLAPWAILAVSLIATGLLWHGSLEQVEEFEQSRFENAAESFRNELSGRIDQQNEAMRSLRAAQETFGEPDQRQWERLVTSLNLKESLPWVQYVAFVEPAGQRPAAVQLSEAGGKAVSEDETQPAGNPLLIQKIEPLADNERLVGFDIGTQPELRRAAELARDSGEPFAAPLEPGWLPQGNGPSILYLLPAFRNGSLEATVEERRASLSGWIAVQAATDRILGGLYQPEDGIAVEVFSGGAVSPEALIYDSDSLLDLGDNQSEGSRYRKLDTVDVGGRVWTLSFASTSDFGLSSRSNQPAQILLGGLAMSVLLFDIALVLSSTRSSALAMADLMTRRVRESETRVRAVIDHAPDGIITFDKKGVIETFNPGAEAVFRYTATEVKGLNIQELMPECTGLLSDSAVGENNSAAAKDPRNGDDTASDSGGEVLGRRKDGVKLPVELTVSRMELDERHTFMAIVRDISIRKRTQDQLVHDALHDSLTSLPNRSHFMSRLESAVNSEDRRKNRTFALLFLDVDRFKLVNDSLGHTAGDQLLVGIAERLKSLVRPGDTIARLGGDEFAILLQSLTAESEAARIAERIQDELKVPFTLGDEEVYATASIGIAFSSGGSEKPADLLRDADTAMYRAKALGRARFETFHEGMHIRVKEMLQLETALRRALEREEFLVHYQPIVSLDSGRIETCEALVRWNHPERGIVLPNEFISIAEETGLIVPISEWVLRKACEQANTWQHGGLEAVSVAVNVSPRQLIEEGFYEKVCRVLDETGLDPTRLQLELTESALMEVADETVRPLFKLFAKGIQISLDDFGTGYSSLTYLRRFPISTLKINKITADPDDAAIASGLISLAHSLRLRVVSEQVETAEQLELLRDRGCDLVQGYFLSRPLDADSCTMLLRKGIDNVYLNPRSKARPHLVALSNPRPQPRAVAGS